MAKAQGLDSTSQLCSRHPVLLEQRAWSDSFTACFLKYWNISPLICIAAKRKERKGQIVAYSIRRNSWRLTTGGKRGRGKSKNISECRAGWPKERIETWFAFGFRVLSNVLGVSRDDRSEEIKPVTWTVLTLGHSSFSFLWRCVESKFTFPMPIFSGWLGSGVHRHLCTGVESFTYCMWEKRFIYCPDLNCLLDERLFSHRTLTGTKISSIPDNLCQNQKMLRTLWVGWSSPSPYASLLCIYRCSLILNELCS